MATLPVVGADNGAWGSELNTWLQVGHNADGSHRFKVNIKEAGAACDGVTDDTAAVQAAIDTVHTAGGGVVEIPVARVKCTGVLSLTANVVLRGVTSGPFDTGSGTNPATSTVGPTFLITNVSSPFITVAGANAGVENLIFAYPSQVAPTATTPTVYPATIASGASNVAAGCRFRNLWAVNAYVFVDWTNGPGRVWFQNLNIGAFSTGIKIDNSLDIIFIENVECSVFWDTTAGLSYPQTIDTWVKANGTALWVQRQDNLFVNNFFVFGQNVGLQLDKSVNGAGYGLLSNISLDTCATGISAKSTGSAVGYTINGLFSGCQTKNIDQTGDGTTSCKLTVIGGRLWGAPGNHAAVSGAGSLLKLHGVRFSGDSTAASGAIILTTDTVELDVQGCDVEAGSLQVLTWFNNALVLRAIGNNWNGATFPSTAALTNPIVANNRA